jgi:arylsulfatase A-like enzyme
MSVIRAVAALAAASTVLVGLVPPAAQRVSAQVPPPNILVIVTDDQPSGSMESLAATGRWFEGQGRFYPNATVSIPLCCPARASILTGRHAHNHGVRTNYDAGALAQDSTVQAYLKGAGYRTGIAGKFLNSWNPLVNPPYFDRWAVFSPINFGHGYYRTRFNVDGTMRRVPGYSTDFIADQAVRFLEGFEGQDAAPWFLYVAPFAPHGPSTPEKEYRKAQVSVWDGDPGVRESDRRDKPPVLQTRHESLKDSARVRRRQLRSLYSVDELVRDIMRRMGQLGERTQTLAFFLSDNGYLWGQHGYIGKRFPYTEAVSIPFFIRWPGRVIGNQTDVSLVTNLDVAPTILDVAGVTPDPRYPMDGRSLLTFPGRARTFIEYFRDPDEGDIPPWASLRTRAYQYVEYYSDDFSTITFREYYDLQKDPYQLTNLLDDGNPGNDPSAATVAELSAQLAADRRCIGTTGPSACP